MIIIILTSILYVPPLITSCLLVPDPHTPPRNVESFVTGSKTATITWVPPIAEHQNGRIAYYILIVSDEQFNISDLIINTTATVYYLTDLEEYNNYSFKVAAGTVGGLGPYSTPIFFITMQDSK